MTIAALTHVIASALLQVEEPAWRATLHRVYEFLSPYNEFIVILFVLWLFARRGRPGAEDFNRQAQEVLEQKYRTGEISRKAYEKYRQDISMRPRR
jgi:hypothetical protein